LALEKLDVFGGYFLFYNDVFAECSIVFWSPFVETIDCSQKKSGSAELIISWCYIAQKFDIICCSYLCRHDIMLIKEFEDVRW